MLFSLRLFSADYIEYLDYLLSLTIYIILQNFLVIFLIIIPKSPFSLWGRANARNVRLYFRIGTTLTFLYFDLYLYSAYAQHTTFNPKSNPPCQLWPCGRKPMTFGRVLRNSFVMRSDLPYKARTLSGGEPYLDDWVTKAL